MFETVSVKVPTSQLAHDMLTLSHAHFSALLEVESLSVITAVAAGLVAGFASVPHCAAMCGPLALYACGRSAASPRFSRAASLYQAGRLVSYGVFGAMAAAFGQHLASTLAGTYAGAVTSWLFALALAVSAAQLFRAARVARQVRAGSDDHRLVALRRAGPPREAARPTRHPIHRLRNGLGLVIGRLPRDPWLVGLLSVLLPCGALTTALVLAAASGEPLHGAATMLAFSAASGVGVLGVGALGRISFLRRSPLLAGLLASAMMVGAVLIAVRPVPRLLQADGATACHDP